jgi:peptide deformylase
MLKLNIETGADNKILRTASQPIEKFDKKLTKLLNDMRQTLKGVNGLGLAAPQVGHNIRAAVCILNYGTEKEIIVDMINPEILSFSEEMITDEEGCLSLPGQYGKVARHKSLKVRYFDRKGKQHTLVLENLNAVIVQHEVDHLDGKLFIDRLQADNVMMKHAL